jgi:retinol dehydrogenase-12
MGSSASRPPRSRDDLGGLSTGDDVASLFGEHARGKTVIITGGSSGLGFETARVLALHGAHVVIATLPSLVEDGVSALRAAVEASKGPHNGPHTAAAECSCEGLAVDLSDLSHIRKVTDAYVSSGRPLHVLINNAGLMACPLRASIDGYEMQFATNFLGAFAFTRGLLPALKRTAKEAQTAAQAAGQHCYCRVINMSSASHSTMTPPSGLHWETLGHPIDALAEQYNPWEAYAMSKLALILFAAELNARSEEEGWGIQAVSLHPGAILGTSLYRYAHVTQQLQLMLTFPRLWHFILFAERPVTKTIPQGVATTITVALDPEIKGGGYYSNCRLVPPGGPYYTPLAQDRDARRRLWDIAEQLTAEGAKAMKR